MIPQVRSFRSLSMVGIGSVITSRFVMRSITKPLHAETNQFLARDVA
jgi:hypothetical protein